MTPFLTASALLLAITLGYSALCAASPFGNCRKCNGLGFALTTDRKGKPKRGKTCRRCKGHGIRIRVGRHLFNIAARLHRDGTR
ncbi:hypothetical protein ACFZDF_01735 [Streptomyces sp. NPDC007910]|uniref:hypothetical protein n=1 Tax=Streptomyces sp. NPDC007910 TaxID=3364790 RepID=UPI0036E2ED28